jgi:hypothetical protein
MPATQATPSLSSATPAVPARPQCQARDPGTMLGAGCLLLQLAGGAAPGASTRG